MNLVAFLEQSRKIAKSGCQTRLPVLPTMLYGYNFLNLNLKLNFNPKSNITIQVFVLEKLLELKFSIRSQMLLSIVLSLNAIKVKPHSEYLKAMVCL